MSAKKLIITDDQKEDIRGYVAKGLTGVKIAKKLKVSQSTMWRIMEEMGLNNKQKKCKKKRPKQIFNWNSFKNRVI